MDSASFSPAAMSDASPISLWTRSRACHGNPWLATVGESIMQQESKMAWGRIASKNIPHALGRTENSPVTENARALPGRTKDRTVSAQESDSSSPTFHLEPTLLRPSCALSVNFDSLPAGLVLGSQR